MDRKEYYKGLLRRKILFAKGEEERQALRRFASKIEKVPEKVERYT